MSDRRKKMNGYSILIIILVMLTGGGFGALTGGTYSPNFWWIGMAVGLVSSFFLAKWYLKILTKLSAKGYRGIKFWFTGTALATLFGTICTLLVHGVMLITNIFIDPVRNGELPITDALIFVFGIIIGPCVALVVGAICTLLFTGTKEGREL